jgi:hypothetical protein
VIPEATTMVCAQVIGNDTTIAIAGQSGNFQLNVMLPVIAYNLLQSMRPALTGRDGITEFPTHITIKLAPKGVLRNWLRLQQPGRDMDTITVRYPYGANFVDLQEIIVRELELEDVVDLKLKVGRRFNVTDNTSLHRYFAGFQRTPISVWGTVPDYGGRPHSDNHEMNEVRRRAATTSESPGRVIRLITFILLEPI